MLTYAMRRDRAEHLIDARQDCGFEPRGLLACGGAAAKLVERTPSLAQARTDGAVAVIDIGHERTDVVVVHRRQGGVQPQHRARRQARHRGDREATGSCRWHDAERAKHADGFVASTAEPATSPRRGRASTRSRSPSSRRSRATCARRSRRAARRPGSRRSRRSSSAAARGCAASASFLTEQLGDPGVAARPPTTSVALAGPRARSPRPRPRLPIDSAAMTVGMAYDAAGGRPQFDLRSGALAVKIDLSFLRAKAVPLGAARARDRRVRRGQRVRRPLSAQKAEKTLTHAARDRDDRACSAQPKTADEVLDTSGRRRRSAATSPLPKMSAYDLLLEINAHVPAKDKITLDIDKLEIDDQKVDIVGHRRRRPRRSICSSPSSRRSSASRTSSAARPTRAEAASSSSSSPSPSQCM